MTSNAAFNARRLQPTYEGLKLSATWFVSANIPGLQPTYEGLKLGPSSA